MYRMERRADGLTISFAARLDLVERACADVEALLVEAGRRNSVFVALLGLREALTNAICHGAGQDAAKKVEVAVRCEEEGIVIRVSDPGPGFDWRKRIAERLACMAHPSSQLPERGRGLCILLHYCSGVSFSARGNVVEMQLATGAAANEPDESSQ